MSLSGVYAVVTGGASGLGRATAKFLAGNGAKVLVADLHAPQQAIEGFLLLLLLVVVVVVVVVVEVVVVVVVVVIVVLVIVY